MAAKPVTIVTGNATKFAEMAEALGRHGIEAVRVALEIPEIQSLAAEEVITDKVRKAFQEIKGPVLVDDSGIYFDGYDQFPGTFSKPLYQAIGFRGIFRLIQPGARAIFHCYVGYLDTGLQEPMIFHGQYPGTLLGEYDDSRQYEMPYAIIFQPDGVAKPMSAMTPEERANDHRHQALNAFADWYTKR